MVGDLTNGGEIPDMHVLEGMLTLKHTLGEEKIPVLWTLHAAYNLTSFNLTAQTNANVALADPTSNASNALAMFAGLHIGKVDHFGDWAGGLEWGYIEPDAVFSAFNDPNPGLGHNNNTWFKGNVEMGLDKGLSLNVQQYVDWRVNYAVYGPVPTNVIGTTSQDPILRFLAELTATF
jgi:hypothetical protein